MTPTPYTGARYLDNEVLVPILGPAVQWFLTVRDRLATRGIGLSPATRDTDSTDPRGLRITAERFVVDCPVAGCAGLAILRWNNRHRLKARARRRTVWRWAMAAGLGPCRGGHSEAEMLAALGDDLAPFPPTPVDAEDAR
jgi:hypothetical protein